MNEGKNDGWRRRGELRNCLKSCRKGGYYGRGNERRRKNRIIIESIGIYGKGRGKKRIWKEDGRGNEFREKNVKLDFRERRKEGRNVRFSW